MDLPPAPTPPVNSGGVPSNNSDRTANLLNLLKFNNQGSSAAQQLHRNQREQYQQQLPQQQQPQPHHHQSPPENEQQFRHQEPSQFSGQHHNSNVEHQQPVLPPFVLPTTLHQPAPAGGDPSGLLAALMRGAHEADESKDTPPPPAQAPSSFNAPPSDGTTSYLLNLLNRPKPSQTEQPHLPEVARNDVSSRSPDQMEASQANRYSQYQPSSSAYLAAQQYMQQQLQHRQSDSFAEGHYQSSTADSLSHAPTQDSSADVSALYQQLMGSLAQSSPQSSNAQAPSVGLPFHVLKKDGSSPAGSQHADQPRAGSQHSPVMSPPDHTRRTVDRSSSLHSHHSTHRSAKHTPPTSDFDSYASIDRNKETVSEAISDIAGQADRDAREALERAEHSQTRSGDAQDQDLRETALAVEHQVDEIEKSLKSDHHYDSTEQELISDIRHSVRSIVDDSKDVADSWESADQEEIVVEEDKEPPPIKVYNFPMKPWISITLEQEEAALEQRPEFREESIMDIGRLKKEFDQMDRNLYTASQTYMTYGMSRQGGMRVIRQDDGKDIKVFSDTKDRIFNLGMSVTPSDHEGIHKEAIIGTGVSGTVYWVQIKEGEKDHIDDPHLEQHGFALPPISSQEGDAPGGVLKTRARASTAHPEFFAVGRGKSINLIWPSYILQNKLFQPGHDRVVDTDALLKQSSLKINTGKAGKDFTFSQDDTVVVSLDKSGRVKFWDVRELTAEKDGSDPRSPMPAQSSLEVKEPLLTLASTPEGEKAWPTSVLLLDKQRPYQKRCALRYLIVGMKQNHTLQLWDLALGKPVQEFNLPHSKESDAVCSVMYHAATGMIVIGHPTRNSIYFAHLSAPKYNLKSVSQAEYIQRLVAQDATIPQPDSTAVISGFREYSFNRGILRSLDILCDPAMTQDSDEPTLFELYAMHSKGVACILIKQSELGWSKDNKVIDGVDAVVAGVVTVSKLKTPQPETSAESSQVRITNRAAPKELLQAGAAQNEPAARGPESVTPVKAKAETKDTEPPVQSVKENHTEKPERKSRKKKAANQSEATTNGNANSPRVAPSKSDAPKATTTLASSGISSETLDSAITTMESRLSSSLADSLKSSMKNLQGKIDEGARARDDTFNQHQLKLLDMVSEVLNDNTQKVLESLIHHEFTDLVIPAIGDKAGKAVTDLLNNKLQPHVGSVVQKEIQNALPHALSRSLRSADFVNAISDRVGASVASTVQQEVLATLSQRLTPTFTSIATQSAQRVAGEVHQQYHDQFERMKTQHVADSNKIDQLLSYVTRLTDMVSTMAASQSALQAEFLKFKAQPVHELPGAGGPQSAGIQHSGHQGYAMSVAHSNNAPSYESFPANQPSNPPQQFMGSPQYMRAHPQVNSPHGSAPGSDRVGPTSVGSAPGMFLNQLHNKDADMDQELAQRIRSIEQHIQEGRLQDAMIQWIQSGKEAEIFRRCLSRYPAAKFEELPPLMLLVVIATISKDLKPNQKLKEEVEWIEMAVRAFRGHMPGYDWDQQGFREVMQSTSQTMELLISRVNPLLAAIQDGFPTDPFLASIDRSKLEWIVRTSEHILDSFGGSRR